MRLRAALARLLPWLGIALLITAPGSFSPVDRLLGDPRIDVWNHAWGFHWVADSLASGRLPWWTDQIGAPSGGVLWFIDLWGALWATPLTLLFGPAVGYNAALVARVALAGLGGQLLSEELGARGPPGWLGGLACASAPFLLAELRNGISEVTAVGAVALALWATARALRKNGLLDFILAGVLWGAAAAASFYYGLVVVLLGGLWLLGGLARGWRSGRLSAAGLGQRLLAVALAAAPLGLPPWLLFRASLAHPQALVRRPPGLDLALLEHNAVDPQVYLRPGAFQSVDLAARFGEPFVHTGYLRLSVVALALVGLVAAAPAIRGRLRAAGALAALSLVIGLGSALWFDGAWVAPGGWRLSLPFGWLRMLLPQVAITHPLRLSVGAQVLLPALAAAGVAPLAVRLGQPVGRLCGLLALVVLGEGLFGSAVRWPIVTSSAEIPAFYADLPPGMVLDLPVEAGTGMQTSAWFWYQTGHGRPLPWTPDVRLGSARDEALMRILGPSRPSGGPVLEAPHPLDAAAIAHLRSHYGAIVLHGELAASAGLEGAYVAAFTAAFGPPELRGADHIWRLSRP